MGRSLLGPTFVRPVTLTKGKVKLENCTCGVAILTRFATSFPIHVPIHQFKLLIFTFKCHKTGGVERMNSTRDG